MSFLTSAVLLVTLCTTGKECRTDEVARFGLEDAGQMYCSGFSVQLNHLPPRDSKYAQTYFCVPPSSVPHLVTP